MSKARADRGMPIAKMRPPYGVTAKPPATDAKKNAPGVLAITNTVAVTIVYVKATAVIPAIHRRYESCRGKCKTLYFGALESRGRLGFSGPLRSLPVHRR